MSEFFKDVDFHFICMDKKKFWVAVAERANEVLAKRGLGKPPPWEAAPAIPPGKMLVDANLIKSLKEELGKTVDLAQDWTGKDVSVVITGYTLKKLSAL